MCHVKRWDDYLICIRKQHYNNPSRWCENEFLLVDVSIVTICVFKTLSAKSLCFQTQNRPVSLFGIEWFLDLPLTVSDNAQKFRKTITGSGALKKAASSNLWNFLVTFFFWHGDTAWKYVLNSVGSRIH